MTPTGARSFFEAEPPSELRRFWVREAIRKHVATGAGCFQGEPRQRGSLEATASVGAPLVNRRISQHVDSDGVVSPRAKRRSPYEMKRFGVEIDQFPADVRVRRGFQGMRSRVGGGRRGSVDAFSDASRRRLAFTARNAFPRLVSQFGMTYHQSWGDGQTVKKHLNRFLNWVRRNLPDVGYLWVFEFQSRGAPHFHLFLSCPANPDLGKKLGAAWNRIAARGDVQHLAFHQHERNFIDWDMGSGSYLTKYLEKSAQKCIPLGFGWSGRFWGASRNLVPAPVVHSTDTGHSKRDLARIVRGLGRWHEHKLKRWGRRSRVRSGLHNALIPQGSKILDRLIS